MRTPGDILLISCYELGHQPLGTAWPAAFLARVGFPSVQLDLAVEVLDESAVCRARFVGISVPMHTALRLGVRAAQRIQDLNPDAFICFYGLYATLNARYLLDGPADAILSGEYEEDLVELVERLDRGERPSVALSPPPALLRLRFPLPERRGPPGGEGYARLEREGRSIPAAYVESSRGCLHRCLHCPITPIYGGRFFIVPPAVVLEDIRRQVRAGAGHVTFGDPDFLNGPGHALRLARALHAEFPSVTFDFTAKIEHLVRHEELVGELARLGCLFIVSAVESLSDTVLARLEKGHTRADVFAALRITRDAGAALRPSFVAFTPWTTLEDYVELLDWVTREGLGDQVDPIQLTIRLLVPPGSALLDTPWMQEHLGELDEEALSYRWVHPDPRMDRLQQDVSDLVEAATERGDQPAIILDRIRDVVATLGVNPERPPVEATALPNRSPRLSEPWFC
jgi:radical SAM superfamily enzyme YgiQ (UPF0313 family)